MTFKDLQKESLGIRAVATLETFAPRKFRALIKEILILLIPVLVALSMFFSNELGLTLELLYGVLFAVIFLLLIFFAIDFFFYSKYFESLHSSVHELGFSRKHWRSPFELLHLVFETDPQDITKDFISSSYGREILARLGINKATSERFLGGRTLFVKGEQIRLPDAPTFSSYAAALYNADQSFSRFLLSLGISRKDFVGATDWVFRMIETRKSHLRWWSRDSLGKIRGIGKEWAHGKTFHLKRYGEYLMSLDPPSREDLFSKEVGVLERVLVKSSGINALIVSRGEREALEVVEQLAWRIDDGTVLPPLEHKRIYVLNTKELLAVTGSRTDLERELLNILHEAEETKGIIFVIPDFDTLVSTAGAVDLEILGLLAPYLNSPKLHIIALSDTSSYLEVLEGRRDLLGNFERILVEGYEEELTLRGLEEKVSKIERHTKLFITYQALMVLVKNIRKSHDLLSRLVSDMVKRKKRIVVKDDVLRILG